MFEYLKSLEKDSLEFITESAFCEHEIEEQKIENDYNMSIRLIDIQESSDEEVPISKRKKFASAISNKTKSLCAAIGNSLDGISKKLTSEEGMDIHDYLSSKEGEFRMDHDIKKIQEDVKKAAREGDALVQAISKGLHTDDKVVDDFVTKTVDIFKNNGETIVAAAAAATVYGVQISLYDDMRKNAGKDGVYQQCASMDGQEQIRKIMNAMSNMFNKEMRIYSIFMNKFDSLKRKNK